MTPAETAIFQYIVKHPGESIPESKIRKMLHLSHGCVFQTRKKLEAAGLLRTERRGRCLVFYPVAFQDQDSQREQRENENAGTRSTRIQRDTKKISSNGGRSNGLSKWRKIRQKSKKMPVYQGEYNDISEWAYDVETCCGNVVIDYGFQTATVTNMDTGDELLYSWEETDCGIVVNCDS